MPTANNFPKTVGDLFAILSPADEESYPLLREILAWVLYLHSLIYWGISSACLRRQVGSQIIITTLTKGEIVISNGGLAQLARALRWQRRGHRFESDILHNKNP